MSDYKTYRLHAGEWIRFGLMGMVGGFFLIYLFYQTMAVALPAGIMGAFLFPLYKKKNLAANRQWELMVEFKDATDSMVSALIAGYSMENAVSEAYKDLSLMYTEECCMLRELKGICQKVRLHEPLDAVFLEFAGRSGVEDIVTFAQIYATARKSGGNLVKIMKRTADHIGEKMEIQREIRTMIAGKKMESICMMLIPLFIILYLQVFSPGFLQPLYEGYGGRIFMTGALFVYALAVLWSRSIMNIPC